MGGRKRVKREGEEREGGSYRATDSTENHSVGGLSGLESGVG